MEPPAKKRKRLFIDTDGLRALIPASEIRRHIQSEAAAASAPTVPNAQATSNAPPAPVASNQNTNDGGTIRQEPEKQKEDLVTLMVPSGRLGISVRVADNNDSSLIVSRVNPSSVMHGKLHEGDTIVSLHGSAIPKDVFDVHRLLQSSMRKPGEWTVSRSTRSSQSSERKNQKEQETGATAAVSTTTTSNASVSTTQGVTNVQSQPPPTPQIQAQSISTTDHAPPQRRESISTQIDFLLENAPTATNNDTLNRSPQQEDQNIDNTTMEDTQEEGVFGDHIADKEQDFQETGSGTQETTASIPVPPTASSETSVDGTQDEYELSHQDSQYREVSEPIQEGRTEMSVSPTPSSQRPSLIRDDPDWILLKQRVENSIIKAEEKWLMEKIDRDIIKAEERDLMDRIDQYILAAERAPSPPPPPLPPYVGSKVMDLCTYQEGQQQDSSTEIDFVWTTTKVTEADRHKKARDTNDSLEVLHDGRGGRVLDLEHEDMVVVQAHKILPRYIPGTDRLLLPHHALQTGVVDWLNARKPSWGDKVVFHINDAPGGDEGSISLYVQARRRVVEQIKERVNIIMKQNLQNHNLDLLVSDLDNLEIELKWKLGPELSTVYVPERCADGSIRAEGVALSNKEDENLELVDILGDDALESLAAILRVDNRSVATPERLQTLLQDAVRREAKYVKLSLCLSKHARLKHLDIRAHLWPNSSIQRRGDIDVFATDSSFEDEDLGVDAWLHNTSASSLPSLSRDKQHSPEPEKLSSYNSFTKKYDQVKDIEYGASKIHIQFVNSRMWKQHKRLGFGTSCSDECPCVERLASLTETIIPEYLAEQESKHAADRQPLDLKAGDFLVGFTNNFAPRFFPKLREEYPQESHAQILRRLENMWAVHKRNRKYGLVCKMSCSCREGWDRVFNKGEQSTHEVEIQESTEKQEGEGSNAATSIPRIQRKSSVEMTPTPALQYKKRPPISDAPQRSLNKVTQESGLVVSGKMERNPKSSKDTTSAKTASHQKEYSVTFDPQEPLGFYCITEKKGSEEVCKITSVNPHKKDADVRLRTGTIAVAASILKGSTKVPNPTEIRSSWDLKGIYDDARDLHGAKLHISFINSDVKASAYSSTRFNKDWKINGVWQGKAGTKGWPGGALTKRAAEPKTRSSSPIGGEIKPIASGILDSRTESDKQADTAPLATEVVRLRSRPLPSKDLSPGPSLLRASRLGRQASERTRITGTSLTVQVGAVSRSSRNVRFVDNSEFEIMLYQTGSNSTDFLATTAEASSLDVLRKIVPEASINQEHQDLHEGELMQAAGEQSYDEVVRILYEGVAKSEVDEAKRFVGNLISSLESRVGTQSQEEKQKLIDAHLKMKALKIFLQSKHAVDKARNAKKVVRYNFQIQRLENLQLTEKGHKHGSSNVLTCSTSVINGGHQIDLKPAMPHAPLSRTIDWVSMGVIPTYDVSCNKYLESDRRKEIAIVLKKGDGHSSGAVRLGRIVIPVTSIPERDFNEEGVLSFDVVGSEHLSGGQAKIKFSRKLADESYIKQKKMDIRRDISKAVDWLEQFCSETEEDDSVKHMVGNIKASDGTGFSLLHAAVSVADANLVERLLKLGADPKARGESGSAIYMASNMEKILKVLVPGNEDETNEAQIDDESETRMEDLTGGATSSAFSRMGDAGSLTHHTLENQQSGEPEKENIPTEEHTNDSDSRNVRGNTSALPDSGGKVSPVPPRVDDSKAAPARPEALAGDDSSVSPPAASDHSHDASDCPARSPHSDELPLLADKDWMVPKKKKKTCVFFNRPRGCWHGHECRNRHVRPLLGSSLDREGNSISGNPACLDQKGISILRRKMSRGLTWISAGYEDPGDKTIYYAEGGGSSRRSHQDVFWYPNEADATEALARVVTVWNRLNGTDALHKKPSNRGRMASESQDYYGPGVSLSSTNSRSSNGVSSPDYYGPKVSLSSTNSRSSDGVSSPSDSRDRHTPPFSKPGNHYMRRTSASEGRKPSLESSSSHEVSKRRSPVSSDAKGYYAPEASITQRRRRSSESQLYDSSSSFGDGSQWSRPHSPHLSSPPKRHELPTLNDVDWMSSGKDRRCLFFNSAKGCKNGHRCRYEHIKSSLGSILDVVEGQRPYPSVNLDDGGICLERMEDSRGRLWMTAAYKDPTDNCIYYAERGANSFQSSQGIYWYPEETDALDALRNVVAVWRFGRDGRHVDPTQASTSAPRRPSLEQHDPPYQPALKRPRLEEERKSPDHFIHNRVMQDTFRQLLDSSNYSPCHQKVAGSPLKREYWHVRSKDDQFTARFYCPQGAMQGDYLSNANFDGILNNNYWWHKDERSAKASAFLRFLEVAAEKGIVDRDLAHTCEGKPLFSSGNAPGHSSKFHMDEGIL